MNVLEKLKKLPVPSFSNYIVGFDDTMFSDSMQPIMEQLIRLRTSIALPVFYLSNNFDLKLIKWLGWYTNIAKKWNLSSVDLVLYWSPWTTYCKNLPPTDSSSAVTQEVNIWHTWLNFWKTQTSKNSLPVNVRFFSDTECYRIASWGIPNGTSAEKASWDQNLAFRYIYTDVTISQYYPNSSNIWYGLGQVVDGRLCPYFPETYLGKQKKGPISPPIYYNSDLIKFKKILDESKQFGLSKGINDLVPIITFSGSYNPIVRVYSTDITWPTSTDVKIGQMLKDYKEVVVWYGSSPSVDDKKKTRADFKSNVNITWWNHFISYLTGEEFAATSVL